MTNRSGQYRIDRAAVDRLRAEIDAALPPLRAKPLRSAPKAAVIEPIDANHREFLRLFGLLTSAGWTQRALARHLGLKHHRPLIDWREGNRVVSEFWLSRMRELLTGTDPELPSSTGTWG